MVQPTPSIQFREYLAPPPPKTLRRSHKAFCRFCNHICHTTEKIEINSRLSTCQSCSNTNINQITPAIEVA